jgi:polysaccharide biosynthesis protein PslG
LVAPVTAVNWSRRQPDGRSRGIYYADAALLSRAVKVLLVVVWAAAIAPGAHAATREDRGAPPIIAIGEQNPQMFSNPYFRALDVKHVRVMAAWDALRHRWSRNQLDTYMHTARAAGVDVLLGFGHARSPKRLVRRYVPSVKEFTREFLKFKKRYPWVTDWLTWNEANLCGEPTCHMPRRVARFYNNIRHNCYGCNVVGADVLDTPTMVPWIKEFKKTARKDKMIWGLHNYIDANRFRTKGTRQLVKATGYGQIWFTETGGLVVRRNKSRIAFPGNKKHAAAATRQVFKLAALSPRIRRVYFFNWQAVNIPLPGWDSALVDKRGKPRPSYYVVRSWLTKTRREFGASASASSFWRPF